MLVAGVLLFGVLGAAAFGAYRFFVAPAAEAGAPVAESAESPTPNAEAAVTPPTAAPPIEPPTAAVAAVGTEAAANPPADGTLVDPSVGAPPPAPVAERREARQERRAAVRVATTVAVVGSGDPAIIIPVVQAIEDRASNAGWQLSENPDGADRIIRVSFDQTGTQQLQYYGRSSEMVIGQLSVRAFGPAGRALGPGFRSRVEYTALNADAKADEAFRGRLDGVVGAPEGR